MRYLLLILVACISMPSFAQKGNKEITLEDVWKNGTFRSQSVPGFNAMKDGERYSKIDRKRGEKRQQIKIYNIKDGKELATVFDTEEAFSANQKYYMQSYEFSEDEQKLLLKSDAEYIYRRSAKYIVYVYDIKTKSVVLLDDEKVLHASFSPDGTKVAFVKENDLYYKDLAEGNTIQVTHDGKWNEIINGNCDWVYEEEFGFTKAFQWSPDGNYLAFYRFDETAVREYTLPYYKSKYPKINTYKYPKAGEDNSIVKIHVYSLSSKVTQSMDIGKETDQYIPRIKWSNNPKELCIYRLNRLQNKLELLLANADNGYSTVIYEETNKYYVDINDNLEFLPDGQSFVFTSERDGYNHLYYYNWNKQKLKDLTVGEYDIDNIVGVDKKRKLIYYTAAINSALERKLYSVDWKGGKTRLLTPEDGTHSITAIEGFNYFLDNYTSLNEPSIYYLRNAKGKIVSTLEDNIKLKLTMNEYDLGKLSFTTFKSADGVDLNAWMITPPNFDKSKKYPVLMFQYSGPGSQQVADRFPVSYYFWHQMLAQKGYIVVCADGTGTGFRGEEFKKKTYLQLGKLESDDQIAVAKQLRNLSYVDANRIGIWGWSYGGFMSSTCLFKGGELFKMAIAVAPVTNWKYYDNIYTERYMRTPQENQSGYEDNAPENMVEGMTGKFLLVHGTGDDNVHVQNAMMLHEALVQADKDFDSEYYTNKRHGISGGNTRYHLFKKMTDFILNNL
ncbi:MAG: S9 family peptidase [Flavipsychrobacter sp.]